MSALYAWFRSRSPREQRLLLVMGCLIAGVIVWLALVRPLSDAHADARERFDAAIVARAQARAAAEAIGRLEKGKGSAPIEPVDALVGRAASEAGFQLAQLQVQDGSVSIAIEAARPQAFFGWVSGLEARGLVVDSLSATSNADRTLAVRATLRARAR